MFFFWVSRKFLFFFHVCVCVCVSVCLSSHAYRLMEPRPLRVYRSFPEPRLSVPSFCLLFFLSSSAAILILSCPFLRFGFFSSGDAMNKTKENRPNRNDLIAIRLETIHSLQSHTHTHTHKRNSAAKMKHQEANGNPMAGRLDQWRGTGGRVQRPSTAKTTAKTQ